MEMNTTAELQLRYAKKQTGLLRACLIVLLLFLIVFAGAMAYLLPDAQALLKDTDAAVANVNNVLAAVNPEEAAQLVASANTVVTRANELLGTVSDEEYAALIKDAETAVAGAASALEQIGAVDFSALNGILQGLGGSSPLSFLFK